ncbi:MAG TPA: type II toxin-antitoxin system RelE/ParE family toxin [Candidatus Methylomirabilis sp.]|nr:type II toxin-antitoxin system RelE/ParE family toxin [Candidatus Methylomirabilis sp.]
MKVQFTPSARLQFLSALAYIRQDNPTAAVRFRKKAESVLRRLEKFPESGRAIPEFPELPYRELIVAPYRFFYRVEGKIVWIVAVWHGAQLPDVPSGEQAL